MRTVQVNLPAELDEFISTKVASGLYRNADEDIQAALRILEEDDAKLVALRDALDVGLSSGVAEGDVFARVRARAGLAARTTTA